MRFPHFFIDRPIFAAVLSIVVVILGILGYFSLPAAQYPEITPPTIVVRASYPGANAETVAATVATPIERAPPTRAQAMSCGVSPMTTTRAQAASGRPWRIARSRAIGTR